MDNMEKGEIEKGEMEKSEMKKSEMEKAEMEKAEMEKGEIEKAEMEKAEMEKGEIEKGETEKGETEKGTSVELDDDTGEEPTETTCCGLKWRALAKFFAYLDMVIVALTLPAGVAIVVLSIIGQPKVMAGELEIDHEKLTPVRELIKGKVFTIFGMMMLAGVSLWAAKKLVQATEDGLDSKDTLSLARIWRNVNLILIACTATGMLLDQTFLACGVGMGLNALTLYIVLRYINALKKAEIQNNLEAANMVSAAIEMAVVERQWDEMKDTVAIENEKMQLKTVPEAEREGQQL